MELVSNASVALGAVACRLHSKLIACKWKIAVRDTAFKLTPYQVYIIYNIIDILYIYRHMCVWVYQMPSNVFKWLKACEHLVTKAFASQSLYSFHQWRCGNCWGGGGSWRFPSGVLPAVPRQVLASLLAIWFSQRHSLEEQMSDHSESVKQWSKVRTFIIMYMCMYKLCNYVYI